MFYWKYSNTTNISISSYFEINYKMKKFCRDFTKFMHGLVCLMCVPASSNVDEMDWRWLWWIPPLLALFLKGAMKFFKKWLRRRGWFFGKWAGETGKGETKHKNFNMAWNLFIFTFSLLAVIVIKNASIVYIKKSFYKGSGPSYF